jgi:hypothetical protein
MHVNGITRRPPGQSTRAHFQWLLTTLLVGGDAGMDLADRRADLNRGVRVRVEVMEPGGMCWLARLGGHHDDGLAVVVVHQRRRPLGAALGARVVDQDDPCLGPSGQMSAELAARSTVESDMELR